MEDNYPESDIGDRLANADVIEALHDYVIRVCIALINRESLDKKKLSTTFEKQDSIDIFRKFISSAESSIVFIEDATSIGGEVSVMSDVTKLHSVASNSTAVPCMAFVKVYNAPLQSQRPIGSQLQALTLSLGGDSNGEDGVRSFFTQLQQLTRHLYAPVVRAAGQNIEDSEGGIVSGEIESINTLQKKFRELDSALEQCQRGTAVPRVVISIPAAVIESSKTTATATLKGFLDKYNGSQVDHLFRDLGIPEVAGSTPETIEEFANEVNKSTKLWPAEIARQTRLVDSVFPNSAEREIDFWKDLEKKLADTKEQLESPGVCLTKLVLKRNNRVSEQLIREAESELDRCIEIVQVSVSFLRDFPIDELQSTTDLSKLSRTTTLCLQHFSKLKHSRYDFTRAVRLIEVVGSAIFSRVSALLKQKDVMTCSIEELRKLRDQADDVFLTWEAQYATQRGTLKDVAKRRKETMRSLHFDNVALQQRLALVVEFREQHERLLNVFAVVMSGQDSEANIGVNEAYQLVIRSVSDAMDISEAGTRAWTAAHHMYEKRLEHTEEKITRLLEDRLGAAQTAEEMFRVFSIFNPLFFRPAIRNAVNSFRAALVKNVREDVRRLQDKFRLRYEDSLERATADLRDIPPLSGTIIWARQIENQLTTLMKRLEDVLGLGWEDHFEGKQLKEVCDELHSYLDTDQLYKDWLQLQLKADTQKYSKLKEFLLLVVEDPRTGRRILQVNFDDKQVVVFKEVRYLEWLLPGMSTTHKVIPSTLLSMSREAYARYPIATALQAALSGFSQAKSGITGSNSVLLTSHVQAVRDIVKEAIGGSKRTKRWIKWDSASDLNDWVGQFSNKVYALQEKVDDVTEKMSQVEAYLQELRMCPYVRASMADVMSGLQATVDEIQIRGFSNVAAWVLDLDSRIESIVLERLKAAVRSWVQAFSYDSFTVDETDNTVDESPLKGRQKGVSSAMKRRRSVTMTTKTDVRFEKEKETAVVEQKDTFTLDPTLHEVLLSNQILFVAPPLEQARVDWISAFHQHVSVVCTLPRISSSRFNVFAGATVGPMDYSSTLLMMDQASLAEPFIVMEEKLAQAKEYAQQWLQYQALWDASSAVLVEKMGRDISKWQQLLGEIKTARTTIDSTTEELSFGPIIVNHKQVQNKVNLKYDTWQKESQLRFGTILLEEIKTAQSDIVGCKSKLEGITLQGPTKEVIAGVEFILKTKSSLGARKQLVVDLESSERLLQKQRYQFPADWLSVSNILGSLAGLCQILDRRIASMDAQLPSLQLKIREEDSLNVGRTEDLLNAWEAERPVQGGLVPNTVLQTLSMFATQVTKLTEDAARVNGAKDALGLDFLSDDRLSFVAREISDLKEVWHNAAPLYERLNAMRGTLLRGDFNPTRIRKQLEELTEELKSLPAKTRTYAAIEWAQETIQKRQAIQPVLRDLSTEALKDRHWKTLLGAMGLSATQTSHDLTLGAIWECNPLAHRKVIQEVLSTAQGELALEQFLRDLREHWVSCELSLALRDGVRLIVGWDVLFSTLEDNLNSLSSLKQSPYFRNVPEFQEDTANWETRLTHLRAIFDIWVEVQRKWVYLRGIFRNPDIKAQLPAQFSKFKSVDNEFLSLMKRVALKPCVVDLLQLDNLARQLERQDTTMTIIQKALGEYLERQRQIFPRFYFVNNDDLVEIIGNSNEPTKILSHLGKMFSAISSIEMTGCESNFSEGDTMGSPPSGANTNNPPSPVGGASASAMCSKEGEVVTFAQPVDLTVGVKNWLSALEDQMAVTLEGLLEQAIGEMPPSSSNAQEEILKWIGKFPAQVVVLSSQLSWSQSSELALGEEKGGGVAVVVVSLESRLRALSEIVLQELESPLRKKCEQLLTEMVHQRDVARLLAADKICSKSDFSWLYHLRFYWSPKETDRTQRLSIRMSSASFFYGFEYQGIGERLVQTPLTDRCYLTLTQALHFRMGANPFGPAGTGKTETVKMLGAQLGRFVLVFNCDSSFDYAAMGRIFAGLCQVGAWGCLDEFNRLEERILSAVSQQILAIQRGLLLHQDHIELLGNPCKLRKEVGIFVTMNPGYAGRSNLPDNLKQLFRAVAMVVPDRKMIAQVMLFSQGIATAEELSGKIVLLFTLCEEQLSAQSHYDFGLRALKSVLVGAGDLKRGAIKAMTVPKGGSGGTSDADDMRSAERDVLIKSTCDSVVPKLVSEDIPLFTSLLQAVFPGSELPRSNEKQLLAAVTAVCEEDSLEMCAGWTDKILQLKQVLDMRHGVMMVGPSHTGKTTAWRTLLKALGRVDGVKGDFYVIDPKSIKKEKLYGSLDPNTLEWTDGVFTKLLRKVSEGATLRGGLRRSWIVFDGDVDPEWAENLNSVLDDNKVLTLPSGDRLKIPNNVRIMMEVDSLKHATMATVSRCGMVWFAEDTMPLDVILRQQLRALRKESIQLSEASGFSADASASSALQRETQRRFVDAIAPHFTTSPGLVGIALEASLSQQHVMEPSVGRFVATLYSLLVRGVAVVLDYNESNSDFPMSDSHIELYAVKWLLHSLLWSFGGSMSSENRADLGDLLLSHSTLSDQVPMGKNKCRLIDLQVNVSDGGWTEWSASVPKIEIETHKVTSSDVIITTTDTVRHVEVLRAWLSSHKPLILCGPPGSGKTMTLNAILESVPEYVLAPLNFSSGTTPDLILKTFAQYCEVVDSPDGLVMLPQRGSYRETQWLVVFCDEINLPEADAYGSQRVIMFLRQLTEQGGFWNQDCKWVSLRRIQFVGACNPPTDAGRVTLSPRFLRHAPLLLVDYPSEASLKQIYRCFNHALLKLHPNLRGTVDSLNNAMVDFYRRNQKRFTAEVAPQYIYSPRELSRWVRAMYEAMEPLEAMTLEELVRLWAHEALRLFHDRLISAEEREWCDAMVDTVAQAHFPGVSVSEILQRPLLYSNWLNRTYQSTDREQLRDFVAARLKVFYEEELDVPLVIFDDVLEHVLRIDNVLRHPMGHLLLVGDSGVGKTVLSRFVSWMNGLTVFQIKANSKYSVEQFDEDLRSLLKRVGVEGEKICFIFDEGNALSSAFLERMNALLASGEIPGLFEGDERLQLMSACRESYSQRDGLMTDSEDELWRTFTRFVQRNLHVVFTMNPASSDFSNRCTASPALFNRCVVDWFGTWSQGALAQVGSEFTMQLDTGFTTYIPPKVAKVAAEGCDAVGASEILSMTVGVLGSGSVTLREAVVAALVCAHKSVTALCVKLFKTTGRQHYLSPRDFLDSIKKFVDTENEKRTFLEEQQTHIRTGLLKLLETQDQVGDLRGEMVLKDVVLREKDAEANSKLSQMVGKQSEAEQRKRLAEELTVELQRQNEQIRVRREQVERELSEAEPALVAAKQSVQNIRKAQLDEVRALGRPPTAVRLTMEMVSIMIGEKSTDWQDIRRVIRRDDFIATVVNFDPLSLTQKQVKQVQDDYLSNAELDYTSVDRASKACGPLYQWAESQIQYATILRRVKPLRDEVTGLTEQSDMLEVRQKEAVGQVSDLETSIQQYKSEYAAAIRDSETIRAERDVVGKKVGRAEALLKSLEQEKDRWQSTSAAFDAQMSTLIGDSLLAGFFLTYAGGFDHRVRKHLMADWSDSLHALGVPFRAELEIGPYLSSPSEQMHWKSCGLPADELAVQNAILLERFNRYPLIIDPSGQATSFILSKYSNQKIAQTSFLDAAFLKTLASAIRFGSPLLVQDVESIDPILNPVLNKELQKTGGRTLIRLGTEDIDFSPKFMIFLTTRNPFAEFAPDLCSRVTLVNFTVTPASLESQALSAILKAERPDVDARRTELLRLQGAQSVKLRDLEEKLLSKISAVQGAILDDDTVINSLETIQAEAADLNKEVSKTLEVIEEVRAISNSYEPLAVAMAAVYFSLEGLSDTSFLYQFSLRFFMEIVDNILSSNSNSCGTAVTATTLSTGEAGKVRLQALSDAFYSEVSRRVLRSLKSDDKMMFVVRLAQIATQGQTNKELTNAEADFLFRGSAPSALDVSASTLSKFKNALQGQEPLEDAVARQLLCLSFLPAFASLMSSMGGDDAKHWVAFFAHAEPETVIPTGWTAPPSDGTAAIAPERLALLKVMLIRCLRPERTLNALEGYVCSVFGEGFEWREHSRLDLRQMVEQDSRSCSPLLLCSEAGQDASAKVDALAVALNRSMLSVAMGSAEGYTEADRSVAQAAKSGGWVLLRNVHLCSEWLTALEKRLHGLTPHDGFRLFLTCEISPKLPSSLLRISEVIVAEASTGIKAGMQRFFGSIPAARADKAPAERCRLYGLLSWFNAVVHERLRYTPLGWTKRYEFNEADAACALDVIDQWVDGVAGARAHVSPEELPWQALRTLLSQSLYGGRIDHPFDQAALDSFIDSAFSPANYSAGACLARDVAGKPLVILPDAFNRQAFEAWIRTLPDAHSPAWLGLPVQAESQLKSSIGYRALSALAQLQGVESADEVSASDKSTQQIRNRSALDSADRWLSSLPSAAAMSLLVPEGLDQASLTSLQRCLAREVARGRNALALVRRDLELVKSHCEGDSKATNALRQLLVCLSTGSVPPSWRSEYSAPVDVTVGAWMADLGARTQALERYKPLMRHSGLGASKEAEDNCVRYWMGGMFTPHSFITATRQHAAQVHKWSLEDLELYLEVGNDQVEGVQDSIVEGLVLEGAKCAQGASSFMTLQLCEDIWTNLPPSRLRWRLRGDRPAWTCTSFPLYLNSSRSELITEVLLRTDDSAGVPLCTWAQRGVAFIMQAPQL